MIQPQRLRRSVGVGIAGGLVTGLLLLTSCAETPNRAIQVPITEAPKSPAVPRVAYSVAGTRPIVEPVKRQGPGGPLDRFFTQLDGLDTHRQGRSVSILQFGDSHTAGDRFSGRLRELFQERFGNSGRGVLPPGTPFGYFRPTGAQVQMSGGWLATTSWGTKAGSGPFGISGFSVSTAKAGQSLVLTSTDPAGFDAAVIETLARPGGGTADIKVDGAPVYTLATQAESLRGARLDLPVTKGARRLELIARGDGPVEVIGWGVTRDDPGVVYESHGTVGATVSLLEKWDEALAGWQLAERDPALIVLAFGTNEGFGNRLVEADYEAAFEGRIKYLKSAAPNADIIVVGPPDANRVASLKGCTPARAKGWAANERGCAWVTPANVAVVRGMQKKVAERQGLRFWDWSLVMGGAGGAQRWTETNPPLMHTDRVHQKPEGYAKSAEVLFESLMADYSAWKSRPLAALPN
ncbi:GDSL-type esterase/lipase family protein [Lacibacterium aquatile]|uniref:GDSL-type esterase/lipase family protein n=1 Tax=Lacibacterium aquatile TaxID=1168082 RepID=A0ABW5DW27_9PROT